MSKILDYVVNNMNVNNNKQQELEVIDELLEQGFNSIINICSNLITIKIGVYFIKNLQ